jgi:RNA polymerase sigma-70 factor (ECF subfamily)
MRQMEDLAGPRLDERYEELLRFVRRRTASDAEAEEITQSVFVQAAARLDAVKQGSAPPLAWLYTVAQRRLIDEARRRATRREAHPLAARTSETHEASYGAEVAATLKVALAALPRTQREVVVLRLVEGRSFAEIAERIGCTEGACKMRFRRGLTSVRATFEQEGIEP